MDKQIDTRTPMTLERFLYEHSTQAEYYLREYQKKHYPPTNTTPAPPAGQVEAVASDLLRLAHNADNHTIASLKQHLFVIHKHLEQSIIKASGAEHIAGLVGALERIAQAEKHHVPVRNGERLPDFNGIKVQIAKDIAKQALSALPPELRGK